jgi:hypothetical protein
MGGNPPLQASFSCAVIILSYVAHQRLQPLITIRSSTGSSPAGGLKPAPSPPLTSFEAGQLQFIVNPLGPATQRAPGARRMAVKPLPREEARKQRRLTASVIVGTERAWLAFLNIDYNTLEVSAWRCPGVVLLQGPALAWCSGFPPPPPLALVHAPLPLPTSCPWHCRAFFSSAPWLS